MRCSAYCASTRRTWRDDGQEEAGAIRPRPSASPSKGRVLRVLGPYLAVYLLDEGLAVLVLFLVLADLLELLDGEAVESPGDLIDGQLLVGGSLQGGEDGCLALRPIGGLLGPVEDLLGYPQPLLGYLLSRLQSLLGGPLDDLETLPVPMARSAGRGLASRGMA
jgi:hypothetical protein